MPATPKICFAMPTGSPTIRVWGACEQVELTAGIWPNTVELRCPKAQYSKITDWQANGDIELYWSSPTVPDVTLTGWRIDYAVDSLAGKQPGDATATVQEKRIVLVDRRWEFLDGLGGHIHAGKIMNRTEPDYTGIRSYLAGFASGLSYRELLAWLIENHLQYDSGLPAYDLEVAGVPVALDGAGKPRNVELDGRHTPTVVQEYLELLEAVWCVNTNGIYGIQMLGSGDSPSLLNELPADLNSGRGKRPATVVITSAPCRAIDQLAIGGIGGDAVLRWEFVGLETDGGYVKLDELSYVVASGKTPYELVREHFASLSDENRALAESTFYKCIGLAGDDRTNVLPLLRKLPSTVSDSAFGMTDRALPLRVQANYVIYTSFNTIAKLSMAVVPVLDVDWEWGVITFPRMLGNLPGDEATYTLAINHFEPLGEGDMVVTVASEASDHDDYRDFYASAWTTDVGGSVVSADVGAAMSPSASGTRVIAMPHLLEMRVGGVPQNKTELDAEAHKVASLILANQEQIRTRRYVGIQEFSPNGKCPAVRWDLRDGITEVDEYQYYLGQCRYIEKTALSKAAREGDGAGPTGDATPERISLGANRYAMPLGHMPGFPNIDWPPPPVVFPALLTGETSGTYSWTEQTLDASGDWTTPTNGRSGTLNAEDINGRAGLYSAARDMYVWMWELRESDGDAAYRFVAPAMGDESFWAKIEAEAAGGGGEYDEWTRWELNDSGVLVASSEDETSSGESLWEINQTEGIEVGTYVRVFRDAEPDGDHQFIFEYGGAAGPSFGKATTAYTHDDNELTVNPCDPDGSNTDTGTSVTVYVVSPQGTTKPPNIKIASGDVVAYMPFDGGAKGMLLPTPLYESLLCGGPTDGGSRYDTANTAVTQGAIITGQGASPDTVWDALSAGSDGYVLMMDSGEPAWDAGESVEVVVGLQVSGGKIQYRTRNIQVLSAAAVGGWTDLTLTVPSAPGGPSILSYDTTSGIHWLGLSAAYHGAFRSSGGTVESTPQKFTS